MQLDTISISGSYAGCKPLLIADSHNNEVICAKGSVIQIIAVATGALINVFRGHKSIVTTVANAGCSNSNALIVSCSIDGHVIYWDKNTLQEVHHSIVETPIYRMYVPSNAVQGKIFTDHFRSNKSNGKRKSNGAVSAESSNDNSGNGKDDIYLVIDKNKDNTKQAIESKESGAKGAAVASSFIQQDDEREKLFKVVCYNPIKNKLGAKVSHLRRNIQNLTMISINNEDYVLISSKRKVSLWSVEEKCKIGGDALSEVKGYITCITADTTKGIVVTGHSNGEITIWYNMLSSFFDKKTKEKRFVNTIMHWHAHEVGALALSSDATFLYSGGKEGVVVIWEINTGLKAFCPRLGAEIAHINASSDSSNDAKVAVALRDNSVRIISASTRREEWTIRSLSIATSNNALNARAIFQSDSSFRCRIKFEGRTGFLVSNGYPGQLQSFDVSNQSFKSSYPITSYVYVSQKEAYTRMYLPCTVHYDFMKMNESGYDWMMTVDSRRGENTDNETSLKFWNWDIFVHGYKLNTQIDSPHNDHRITDAKFVVTDSSVALNSFINGTCVTCSVDGTIKIWKLLSGAVTKDKGVNAGSRWTCAYSFKHREVPCNYVSYSSDLSVMALAQENVIYLCNPNDMSVASRTLVNAMANNITFVAFIEPKQSPSNGGGCGAVLLVIGSKRNLAVYNLLTMKLLWGVSDMRFSTFSCAKNDQEAIKFTDKSSGWIAAAVKPDIPPTDSVGESVGQSPLNKEHKILVFSPYSSTPVCEKVVGSKVTSIVYYADTHAADTLPGSGIIAVNEGGEILAMFNNNVISEVHYTEASTRAVTVPKLVVQNNNNKEKLIEDNELDMLELKNVAASDNTRLFDMDTSNIPSISVLYDNFMLSLLKKQKVENAQAAPDNR